MEFSSSHHNSTKSHRFLRRSSSLERDCDAGFLISKIVDGNCRKENRKVNFLPQHKMLHLDTRRLCGAGTERRRRAFADAKKAFSMIVRRQSERASVWSFPNFSPGVLCKLENWIPLSEIKLLREIYLLFPSNFPHRSSRSTESTSPRATMSLCVPTS